MRADLRSAAVPLALALGAAELAGRVLSPSAAPPRRESAPIGEYFTEAELARGRRYGAGQMALGLARTLVDAGALIAVVRRRARYGSPAGASDARPVLAGAGAAAGLSLALSVPGLPFAALARRRSIRVGLSTQSWRDWAVDLAKAQAIELALAAAGGAGVTAASRRWPRGWWLAAAGGTVALSTAVLGLGPVLLDPIFNDFEPLPEGDTRKDVLELAQAAGVRVGEVYSVDASRRTKAANAYVTGLGPTKRVVLFDTLLDTCTRDEVRVVVAHELGHVRHRDVPRGVAFAALSAPTAAFAIQRLSWVLSPERGTPGALPALALAAAIVATPLGLIVNRVSRSIERRADQLSLELSGSPEAFISLERRLALQNVAYVDPPRALSALLATHPPVGERIAMALERDGAG